MDLWGKYKVYFVHVGFSFQFLWIHRNIDKRHFWNFFFFECSDFRLCDTLIVAGIWDFWSYGHKQNKMSLFISFWIGEGLMCVKGGGYKFLYGVTRVGVDLMCCCKVSRLRGNFGFM